jgi:glutamate dehydrogenase (NAD(P)+)
MATSEKKPTYVLQELRGNVQTILETSYRMEMNTVDKILDNYFSPQFLPIWYFHSNSAEEIASHIFIITQLLNATTEYLEQVSEDGRAVTYIANVGRDFPGKLARIIGENINLGMVSYDSVKTKSGIRIVTIEKAGRTVLPLSEEEIEQAEALKEEVRREARTHHYQHAETFLSGLPANYMKEEIHSYKRPRRILRHYTLFETVMEGNSSVVQIQDTAHEGLDDEQIERHEVRIQMGIQNPDKYFVSRVLEIVKNRGINLSRSYFDIFCAGEMGTVGITSLYVRPEANLDGITEELNNIPVTTESEEEKKHHSLSDKLEYIIKGLSSAQTSTADLASYVEELQALVRQNTDIKKPSELGDFLLNSLSDFMEAAAYLGIDRSGDLLRLLLGFDSFEEFWVTARREGESINTDGFRTKHNSARGANKGGIRIDLIVEFVEVAALSFMMTWKCARSKILFGGGKGGLKLNPREYRDKRIDFFDTLTNFGRSLFLVTGPSHDVPAGDVGCGAEEIGHMFEGFKSALRDLAIMAYGVKQGVGIIGNKIISVEQARKMLEKNFDIDYRDKQILRELVTSEKFLELVVAPQITGKPRMGIAARTGATGRGLCYSILAVVGRLYLDNRWQPTRPLSEEEHALVEKVAGIGEEYLLESEGTMLLSREEWEKLDTEIYRKLLEGKKVVVQGSGKVGSSILTELDRYGVDVIAVADVGGAVIGEKLDVDELLSEVAATGTVMGAETHVHEKIEGAQQGAAILELECDILVPAALENAVTVNNAGNIRAVIEACGSNGPNTSKAERILADRGVTVIYDFLANGAGVTASYFEWLRNLAERFRYESSVIREEEFDIDIMNKYIMPEFRERIKNILMEEESPAVTHEWNMLLRDIMFAAVNDDYTYAAEHGISMKTAGFANSIMRVLTAVLLKMPEEQRASSWQSLPEKTRNYLEPYFRHPEARLHNPEHEGILARLY